MNTKPNILFFIPVWQRREITRVCYEGLERFRKHLLKQHGIDSLVWIVSSDAEDTSLAKEFRYYYCETDNKPLGAKFNKGLYAALQSDIPFDYIWQLNSDDLLSNKLADLFTPLFERGEKFFGINKLYAYDAPTGRMRHYEYLDGCGIRVIHRSVIETVGYCYHVENKQSAIGVNFSEIKGERQYIPVPRYKEARHQRLDSLIYFKFWQDSLNKGLDNNSMNRVYRFMPDVFPMRIPRQESPMVVDIKSEENIWTYDSLKDLHSNADYALNDAQKNKVFNEFKELSMLNSYAARQANKARG